MRSENGVQAYCKLGDIHEQKAVAYFTVRPQHLHGGPKENNGKTLLMITGLPPDIQTKDAPTTKLECYATTFGPLKLEVRFVFLRALKYTRKLRWA
jgi:hypothetical protein